MRPMTLHSPATGHARFNSTANHFDNVRSHAAKKAVQSFVSFNVVKTPNVDRGSKYDFLLSELETQFLELGSNILKLEVPAPNGLGQVLHFGEQGKRVKYQRRLAAPSLHSTSVGSLEALDSPLVEPMVLSSARADTLPSTHGINISAATRNPELPTGFEDITYLVQSSFAELDTDFTTQAFVASDRLVRIWVEGLNALRSDAQVDLLKVPSDQTDRSFHKELERDVDTIISNFARYKIYDSPGTPFKLTIGDRFYSRFEAVLADYLALPPRSSVLFLDELRELLVRQASDGPKFKRRWGKLIVDNVGDLVLQLEKMKQRNLDDDFD